MSYLPLNNTNYCSTSNSRIHTIKSNFLNKWNQTSNISKAFFSLSLLNLTLQVTFITVTLYDTWDMYCHEPFRKFLLAHAIRSIIATPFSIYLQFGYLTQEEEQEKKARILLKRIQSGLNFFAIVLFLYGNYLVFFNSVITCDLTAPDIYNLSYIIVVCGYILYAAPVLFTIVTFLLIPCFTYLLQSLNIIGSRLGTPKQNLGATQKEISTLPVYQLSIKEVPCSSSNNIPAIVIPNQQDRLCVICLSDYKSNDILCKLWCEHHFHRKCIFEWLKLNATCPLCKQDCRNTPASKS